MTVGDYLAPFKNEAFSLYTSVPTSINSDSEANMARNAKIKFLNFIEKINVELGKLNDDMGKCGDLSSSVGSIDTSSVSSNIVNAQSLIKNNFNFGDFYPGESSSKTAASSMNNFIDSLSSLKNAITTAKNDIETAITEMKNLAKVAESYIKKIDIALVNWEREKARRALERAKKNNK